MYEINFRLNIPGPAASRFNLTFDYGQFFRREEIVGCAEFFLPRYVPGATIDQKHVDDRQTYTYVPLSGEYSPAFPLDTFRI